MKLPLCGVRIVMYLSDSAVNVVYAGCTPALTYKQPFFLQDELYTYWNPVAGIKRMGCEKISSVNEAPPVNGLSKL